jgi:hypothetical protein
VESRAQHLAVAGSSAPGMRVEYLVTPAGARLPADRHASEELSQADKEKSTQLDIEVVSGDGRQRA